MRSYRPTRGPTSKPILNVCECHRTCRTAAQARRETRSGGGFSRGVRAATARWTSRAWKWATSAAVRRGPGHMTHYDELRRRCGRGRGSSSPARRRVTKVDREGVAAGDCSPVTASASRLAEQRPSVGEIALSRLVQQGREPRAGPGVCSVTRAAASGCLPAGTSHAIGKRLCGRIDGTSVAPGFVPKRNSELSASRGLSADDAVRLEFADSRGQPRGADSDVLRYRGPHVGTSVSGTRKTPGCGPAIWTATSSRKPRWGSASIRCAFNSLTATCSLLGPIASHECERVVVASSLTIVYGAKRLGSTMP